MEEFLYQIYKVQSGLGKYVVIYLKPLQVHLN